MNNLFIIGIFLAFFLQFLLFSKKQRSLSDKILGIWMFVIGIHLTSFYVYHLGFWDKYPHLVGITHPIPLLHGPLLYLYVVFSLRKDQQFRLKDFVHFIPFVAAYLYMLPFFFGYSAEKKVLLDHGLIKDYRVFMNLSLGAFIISGVLYPVFAYRLIGKYKQLIHNNFSFDEKLNLSWLKYCILGIGLVFLTVFICVSVQNILGVQIPFNPDLFYYSEVILFIFFLGYFGIRHKGIFSEASENIVVPGASDTRQSGEYKRSGLKDEDAEKYHQQLLQLMKEKKPYLEPKLTLNILAADLGISVNHLSQLINQYEGRNFYDFINEYRVDEFKSLAASPKNRNFSILALALDSGFNSKSSFNLVFKKHTGMTPSQFMAGKK